VAVTSLVFEIFLDKTVIIRFKYQYAQQVSTTISPISIETFTVERNGVGLTTTYVTVVIKSAVYNKIKYKIEF
jgi:hypothetical protein